MAYRQEGTPDRPVAQHRPRLRRKSPQLSTSRARLRIALFVSLAVVALLGFVIFPARRVTIQADGAQIAVVSRDVDVGTVVQSAGVQKTPGDTIVKDGNRVAVERAKPVLVTVDGRVISWKTHASNIQNVLDELDVAVGPNDAIVANGLEVGPKEPVRVVSDETTPVSSGIAASELDLTVRRAVPIRLVQDDKATSVESSKLTVGEVLDQSGVKLGPADVVTPKRDAPIVAGMTISVAHAKSMIVRVGDDSDQFYTQAKTVGDALSNEGYSLGPDDRVQPPLDTTVTDGMLVRLVRVSGRTFTERSTIEHKTVFKPDDSLSGTQTRVVQGHDGTKVREYRVAIEDGVEQERKLVDERMDPDVQDTVIYYPSASLKAAGLSPTTFNVAKTMNVYATWYNAASSGKSPTDPSYGFTASGAPVTKGIVAVDPRVIPLGTRLYIPGYGFAVAGDTGGGIIGNMIDLGYPDGVAADWRTGSVDIYVLTP